MANIMISISAKISTKPYRFNIIDFIKIFVELHYVIILMFYIRKPVFDQLSDKMAKLHLRPKFAPFFSMINSIHTTWSFFCREIKAKKKTQSMRDLFLLFDDVRYQWILFNLELAVLIIAYERKRTLADHDIAISIVRELLLSTPMKSYLLIWMWSVHDNY